MSYDVRVVYLLRCRHLQQMNTLERHFSRYNNIHITALPIPISFRIVTIIRPSAPFSPFLINFKHETNNHSWPQGSKR